MKLSGRCISKGQGTGPLLISPDPISFLSGVDPDTGIVIEKGHPLEGKNIRNTVLVFEYGKGSTVGSYILYALSKAGHAPAAIINTEAETIIAVGAILGHIPMIDHIGVPLTSLPEGAIAHVNADAGTVEYEEAGT
jgi:predicted aconitase with swiveling domain